MNRFITQLHKRIVTIILMVLVIGSNLPISAFAQTASPTVDVQINGSNGPVTLNSGDSFTYTWSSTGATACQQTSPDTSGVSTSGSSIAISPGHPYYPSAGSSVTITIVCTDGTNTATDSVVVSLSGGTGGAPTVDVKANGSDGPVALSAGDSFTYTWTSTNATACQQTSPATSGVSTSGTSIAISSGHPYYPAAGSSSTITITCTDGTTSVSDSVVVSLGGSTGTPTVDVQVNGSNGPVTLNSGDTFTYTWVSTNATACQQTSPATSGVSTSGTSIVINSSHPYYPTLSAPTTITITCTDGTNTATDSVVVNLAGSTGGAPTVDVKANGSDGPVTIVNGSTYTYTWVSTNATACQQTSPAPTSGVSLSGTSIAIGPGHPFYPATSTPTTITITCTDGTSNATDSVVIGLTSSSTLPTVDVKANGSDGPITINQGDSYVYTWVSANATACQQTTPPPTSGVSLAGTSTSITTSHPFYPTTSNPTTITIVCTDGTNTATDSVVINLNVPGGSNPPSSSSGGRRRGTVTPGNIVASCPLIHDYMRIDFINDPVEVMKLQTFLNSYMGYSYVTVNGVFDQATRTAVGAFQMAYRDEILTPWGHTGPTYYVYILTLKKINEIYCQHTLPLTADQAREIAVFRNLLNTTGTASGPSGYAPARQLAQASHDYGLKDGKVTAVKDTPASVATATTTSSVASTAIRATSTQAIGNTDDKGQNTNNLAFVLSAFPDTGKETVQMIYELVLILIVLYIIGVVLSSVLYNDLPENVLKRHISKWSAIILGLIVAIALSYFIGEYMLILPLLIILILSTIWVIVYRPKFPLAAKPASA